MEDVRKRINHKLVNHNDKFQKLATSPLFIYRGIIDDESVGVKMIKLEV